MVTSTFILYVSYSFTQAMMSIERYNKISCRMVNLAISKGELIKRSSLFLISEKIVPRTPIYSPSMTEMQGTSSFWSSSWKIQSISK